MKQNPLLPILLLICCGILLWVFLGPTNQRAELEEALPNSESVPVHNQVEPGGLDDDIVKVHSGLSPNLSRTQQQEPLSGAESFVVLSSTSGLALKDVVLQKNEASVTLPLSEGGRLSIDFWRPGWELFAVGHRPKMLGEDSTDLELEPFHTLRVTGVPSWDGSEQPSVSFSREGSGKMDQEFLRAGMAGHDWVLVTGETGRPFRETTYLKFPGLRRLELHYPKEMHGEGTIPWSYLLGAQPDSLPLDCEVVGLPANVITSELSWDMVELTLYEDRDAIYSVMEDDWGSLEFGLPARLPIEAECGSHATFEGVSMGAEVAVFVGLPGVGFGWSGPQSHTGTLKTLELQRFPRARMRLVDHATGTPIPQGTQILMHWMWGETKTALVFHPTEMEVGPNGVLEWDLPVDAWSLPIDEAGPYPTRGLQVRVEIPRYEAMQVHQMLSEDGKADFGDVDLATGSWNLVFSEPPKVMEAYPYLFFGCSRIPVEGGRVDSKGKMPVPFSEVVPYGNDWSSIWLGGDLVPEELRTVVRGVSSMAEGSHFYRLNSDGVYHRVPMKTAYGLDLSADFQKQYPGWHLDIVYFTPYFSVSSAIGWRQPSRFPTSQEFRAPSEDLFLKVGPPKGIKKPPVFFPLEPGENSF